MRFVTIRISTSSAAPRETTPPDEEARNAPASSERRRVRQLDERTRQTYQAAVYGERIRQRGDTPKWRRLF